MPSGFGKKAFHVFSLHYSCLQWGSHSCLAGSEADIRWPRGHSEACRRTALPPNDHGNVNIGNEDGNDFADADAF